MNLPDSPVPYLIQIPKHFPPLNANCTLFLASPVSWLRAVRTHFQDHGLLHLLQLPCYGLVRIGQISVWFQVGRKNHTHTYIYIYITVYIYILLYVYIYIYILLYIYIYIYILYILFTIDIIRWVNNMLISFVFLQDPQATNRMGKTVRLWLRQG